ncbi:SigE family RNA polymerase sigma factor [Myceligenerans crystallogenes]
MSIAIPASERATSRAVVQVPRDRDTEFVAFVEATSAYLYRTAYLLTGDAYRAEDLVQTAFERTYRAWNRVRDGEPRAYARRILVNLRTDTWRRTRREVTVDDDRLPVPSSDDRSDDVALRDALVRALSELTPRQRQVIVLRYLHDLTAPQAAEELGCSIGTVKATTSQALARLRGLVSGLDLEFVTAPGADAAVVLRRSRAALRSRRTKQLAGSTAVAVLLSWFLGGPVQVPGVGAVGLPGSEQFREFTGMDGTSDGGGIDGPDGALPAPSPTRPAELVLLDPVPIQDAVSTAETSTLGEDGSFVTVTGGRWSPDVPEIPRSTLELLTPHPDGGVDRAALATSGTIQGTSTQTFAFARQGDGVAWAETTDTEGGPATWTIQMVDDVHDPAAPRQLAEHLSDGTQLDGMLCDPWLGLTQLRVAWCAYENDRKTLTTTPADGSGTASVVVRDLVTFGTDDDEIVTLSTQAGSGGRGRAGRLLMTTHRDDGTSATLWRSRSLPEVEDGSAEYLAVSDELIVWSVDDVVRTLDRATGKTEVLWDLGTSRERVTSVDVSGRDVVWVVEGDTSTQGFVAADTTSGVVQGLTEMSSMGSAGIGGPYVSWTDGEQDGSDPVVRRARLER